MLLSQELFSRDTPSVCISGFELYIRDMCVYGYNLRFVCPFIFGFILRVFVDI